MNAHRAVNVDAIWVVDLRTGEDEHRDVGGVDELSSHQGQALDIAVVDRVV